MEECEYRYKTREMLSRGEKRVTIRCSASDSGRAIVIPERDCGNCKIGEMNLSCQNMQSIRRFTIGGATNIYEIRCNFYGALIYPDKDCIDCESKI